MEDVPREFGREVIRVRGKHCKRRGSNPGSRSSNGSLISTARPRARQIPFIDAELPEGGEEGCALRVGLACARRSEARGGLCSGMKSLQVVRDKGRAISKGEKQKRKKEVTGGKSLLFVRCDKVANDNFPIELNGVGC